MNLSETTISIIIPTHNRVQALERLLDRLGSQAFPLELMEVIVVAFDCTDATLSMLQDYKPPYKLGISELCSSELAEARNKGAALANGSLLVFIDDDIFPSHEFVRAHFLAHQSNRNAVVVGYLPLVNTGSPGYFQLEEKSRREEKFERLRTAGHRFSYTDFSSGNFSIPATLFKKTQGFVTGLDKRADDDFCIRLINLGANFIFSTNACAFQQVEAASLKRSLQIKRDEGKADVRLWRMHPGMKPATLQDSRTIKKYAFIYRSQLLLSAFLKMSDVIVACLLYLLFTFEQLKMQGRWRSLYNRLCRYWYLRGWLDEFPKTQELLRYIGSIQEHKIQDEVLDIDLKTGLNTAAQLLDQLRPCSINVRYGLQYIGTIPAMPGAERIKGQHLRHLLATELSEPLIASWALDAMLNSHRG